MKRLFILWAVLFPIITPAAALLRQWQVDDEPLAEFFRRETRALSERSLNHLTTSNEWSRQAPVLRAQLSEMLGLSPLPPRTDLKAVVTRRLEQETFTVENLHFQSSPGLYVTANLYVPKGLTKPAPTILYVCGHGPVITNGISYGNKFAYHHHGVWLARNGYVCLIIDTLQLGEIQGLHHGTMREGLWWWNSRGYTPAGVECWNGMRALDYLSTRPEVDTNRFGITGRSGGGAYSWFVTAMDDRIKCAAPVAGITDLENYVVDGAVEGHCDCMFFVNTYRWDYPQLAGLAAPRPLLLCNTDSDYIFPLDGVTRTQAKVARVYAMLGAQTSFGLVITPGPHKDTQELQLPVLRWFNRHLKGEEPLVETAAAKLFSPAQLKVFTTLPTDAVNTNIQFTFVQAAAPEAFKTREGWSQWREKTLTTLREKTFAAPLSSGASELLRDIVSIRFQNETNANGSRLLVMKVENRTDGRVTSNPLETPKKSVQLRRRFMLLGGTLDSMRVAQLAHSIREARRTNKAGQGTIRLEAEGDMAVNALYASLLAPVDELVLTGLLNSHMSGPDYLNVLRLLDIPQAVALASERTRIEIRGGQEADWKYPLQVARNFGWDGNLRLVER